jgi:hypothetical protein
MDNIILLARQLAKHFSQNTNIDEIKACACIGLDCGDLSCSQWWMSFLQMSEDDIKRMVRSYSIARGK